MANKRKRPFTGFIGFPDNFQWNRDDKPEEVFISKDNMVAQFHPLWSNGTAAIRGNKPINYQTGKFYWEILVKDRVFGTSMMIGITTRSARLNSNSFINMIGEDEFGWGLSHKGLIWHNSKWKMYTRPFRENKTTRIGCLYDGFEGTLTFFKDGTSLGVAFTGLNLVKENLYPTVSSTAAKTEFKILFARREFCNLQERCRYVIRKHVNDHNTLEQLCLPERIIKFLKMDDEDVEELESCSEESEPIPEKKTLLDHQKAIWHISLTEREFQSNKIPMPDF